MTCINEIIYEIYQIAIKKIHNSIEYHRMGIKFVKELHIVMKSQLTLSYSWKKLVDLTLLWYGMGVQQHVSRLHYESFEIIFYTVFHYVNCIIVIPLL